MRVHKLNNVEQAMDLLEKHKVYLVVYVSLGGGGRGLWEESRRGMDKGWQPFCS